MLIAYAGDDLQDETLYNVTVEVTDNHGNTEFGEMSFETGILNPEVFQANMITHDFPEEETACPIFSKTFAAKGKVKRARIYATSRGVYEASLNGNRIGEDRMTPGWTSYHHRLQFCSFYFEFVRCYVMLNKEPYNKCKKEDSYDFNL